jgi:hypothetical protein
MVCECFADPHHRKIVLKALAKDLSALSGPWRVDDDHVRGPGSVAVMLHWRHNQTDPNHIDIGFVLDVAADKLEVVWDCVVGIGQNLVRSHEGDVGIDSAMFGHCRWSND